MAELRVLNTHRGTISGYFDDFAKLAAVAADRGEKAPGVYVTTNPVNPALLARSANQLPEYAKHTSSDTDVLRRRWLPIDFDAVGPTGISSTDEEHRPHGEAKR